MIDPHEDCARHLQELSTRLQEQIEAGDDRLRAEADATQRLSLEYRRLQEKAIDRDHTESETKADLLRTTIIQKAESDDRALAALHQQNFENLRQHIVHQKEQVDAAFDASKEAILKAEHANAEKFHSVNGLREQLREQQSTFILREVFDQTTMEHRRKGDANLDMMQALSIRMTEIEARGGGQQDQTANMKSTMAIAVSVLGLLVAAALAILNMTVA